MYTEFIRGSMVLLFIRSEASYICGADVFTYSYRICESNEPRGNAKHFRVGVRAMSRVDKFGRMQSEIKVNGCMAFFAKIKVEPGGEKVKKAKNTIVEIVGTQYNKQCK